MVVPACPDRAATLTAPLAHALALQTLVEYVWIGAGSQLCSRTRVLDFTPQATEDVPAISVDGSSCGLAPGDVFLKPRKVFNDPLRGGAHLLCLCDTLTVRSSGLVGVMGAALDCERCSGLGVQAKHEQPDFPSQCATCCKHACASEPCFLHSTQLGVAPQCTWLRFAAMALAVCCRLSSCRVKPSAARSPSCSHTPTTTALPVRMS